MRGITSIWIGTSSYKDGLEIQQHYWQLAQEKSQAFFLGFEFQPVITLGKRSNRLVDVVASNERLSQRGFEVFETDRGGHATLHDEGQLVIYPVVPIKQRKIRLVDFIDGLHDSTQLLFEQFGIETFKNSQPGLYTQNGKITFIGLRILKGISQHGLSINVTNDLSAFSFIRSCGKACERFDSMAPYLKNPVSLEELFFSWSQIAQRVLDESPSLFLKERTAADCIQI